MVQIQYASDLHITDWPKGTAFEAFLTPVAPILVIAGDICSAWNPLYNSFLTALFLKTRVIYLGQISLLNVNILFEAIKLNKNIIFQCLIIMSIIVLGEYLNLK